MLTIYHLKNSRSTRVIWLAEELGLDYQLEIFEREENNAAPAAYRALHPLARAPLIRDGEMTLGESGAIIDYLITRYGRGRLIPKPQSDDYGSYLYWLHFAEGSAMQHLMILRTLSMSVQGDEPNQRNEGMRRRAVDDLAFANEVLGKQPYLAGSDFTGADINMAFVLRFGKNMLDPDLDTHPHIAAYLERIDIRPGFRKANEAG